MRRYAISGLALTFAMLAGCSSAPTRVALDPNVPASTVVYTPPVSTASTTVIAPPGTAVVQAPGTVTTTAPGADTSATTVVPAPGSTVIQGAGGTTVVPGPGTTTVVPGAGAVVSPAPAVIPRTLRVDEIVTQRVRATTIYANKIEANEIRGIVHQDKSLKIGDTKGDIKGAPEVVASVIYADEIKADSVIADNIYVRNIERR